MCLLLESIRIENGSAQALKIHQDRVNRSSLALFGTSGICLDEILGNSALPAHGLHKCRVIYGKELIGIDYQPYEKRMIQTIALAEIGSFDYSHKYVKRDFFEALRALHIDAQELILLRDGAVTDSTFSNLAFFDGHTWFTPRFPLLAGTRRRQLLDQGKMVERQIDVDELGQYQRCSFINAMLDLGDCAIELNPANF